MAPKYKNYRCVVEGNQEYFYLNHLAQLLSKWPEKAIRFNPSVGTASDLINIYVEYDCVCLFDYDFDPVKFEKNMKTCIKLNKQYSKRGKSKKSHVHHGYSNVCFDLWLLLHKKDFSRIVHSNDSYVNEVRTAFNLPNTADIKEEDNIKHILSQISLEDVKNAVKRAKLIKASKIPEDAKHIDGEIYFDNPDLSIHCFIDKVITEMESI